MGKNSKKQFRRNERTYKGHQNLDKFLSDKKLQRKQIAKDGSCLFRAVAEQVSLIYVFNSREGSLVPRPLPPGEGPGAHRLRMCKITSKISVKVSVHYNLPRGTLTSNSNKKLGKSLSCPLPANRPNERFAFA